MEPMKKKSIDFWKMHGAGNDFVLIDDRKKVFPSGDGKWIASVSDRRTGIGCEGIILIQESKKDNFRMRFFNPDGNEVEMCGNGARCVARLAHEIGVAPSRMTIETMAGSLHAEHKGDMVKLRMTSPKDWRLQGRLELGGRTLVYGFVNSGVPHAVVEVRDLAGIDVKRLGEGIRRHKDFAPAGTNANFVAVTGRNSLSIRTYERGVEDETLACGTGIVASALVAGKLGRVIPPVKVTCAHGDVLVVDYKPTPDGASDVTLLGPAVHVFHGSIEHVIL